MIAAMQLGNIPHEDVLKSIKLFGDAVIPNFTARESEMAGSAKNV